MEIKFNDKSEVAGRENKDVGRKNSGGYGKTVKILKNTAIAALILAGVLLFFNYLFIWFLPFFIAWVIAFFIQPAVKIMHAALHIPKKAAAVLVLLLIFAVVGSLIFLVADRIIYELTALSRTFKVDGDAVTEYIDNFFGWFENILDKLPFVSGNSVIEQFKTQIDTFVAEAASVLASKIPAFVSSAIVFLPSFLVFTLILIISTFYICLDYAAINKFIMTQIPKKVRDVILEVKNRFLEAIYKYLRAYLILMFITYFELVTGFLIIGVKYAFLFALLVALVDIFPILGTGTILIPWGITAILQKDYFTGFAMLILYATVTIIRQIIEPKIVGRSIGLYPVVTLIALYVGYNMFGFPGMVLLPVCILLVKNLNEEGRIRLWKNVDANSPSNHKQ